MTSTYKVQGDVSRLAWSPSGDHVAVLLDDLPTAAINKRVQVWNVATEDVQFTKELTGSLMTFLAYNANGSHLYIGSNVLSKKITYSRLPLPDNHFPFSTIDTLTGEIMPEVPVRLRQSGSSVILFRPLIISPSRRLIVCSVGIWDFMIIDANTCEEVAFISKQDGSPGAEVEVASFTPSGARLTVVGWAPPGEPLAELKPPIPPRPGTLSGLEHIKQEPMLYAALTVDLSGGSKPRRINLSHNQITALFYLDEENFVARYEPNVQEDIAPLPPFENENMPKFGLIFGDVTGRSLRYMDLAWDRSNEHFSISPNRKFLSYFIGDGIQVLRAHDGAPVLHFPVEDQGPMAWSPDSRSLAHGAVGLLHVTRLGHQLYGKD